jgi:hypothetical protein
MADVRFHTGVGTVTPAVPAARTSAMRYRSTCQCPILGPRVHFMKTYCDRQWDLSTGHVETLSRPAQTHQQKNRPNWRPMRSNNSKPATHPAGVHCLVHDVPQHPVMHHGQVQSCQEQHAHISDRLGDAAQLQGSHCNLKEISNNENCWVSNAPSRLMRMPFTLSPATGPRGLNFPRRVYEDE